MTAKVKDTYSTFFFPLSEISFQPLRNELSF